MTPRTDTHVAGVTSASASEDLDTRASQELRDAMERAEHEADVRSFWQLLERASAAPRRTGL